LHCVVFIGAAAHGQHERLVLLEFIGLIHRPIMSPAMVASSIANKKDCDQRS
jgi:hypothetical protein